MQKSATLTSSLQKSTLSLEKPTAAKEAEATDIEDQPDSTDAPIKFMKERDQELGAANINAEHLGGLWKNKYCFDRKWINLTNGETLTNIQMEKQIRGFLEGKISVHSRDNVELQNKLKKLAIKTLRYLKDELPKPLTVSLSAKVEDFIV